MEAFITSTLLVTMAEIGDKTQLLSFVLAARLRRPWAIIAGIFVATIINHGLAGSFGVWLSTLVPAHWLPWIIGTIFIAFGIWTLVPDKLDDEDTPKDTHMGAFVTTTIAFFLAEMGDKTQLATVALGARYEEAIVAVIFGTTFGMMLANVPAVLIGQKLADRLPLNIIRKVAATLFVLTGIATIIWG
ncbi:MAG: TMEM165/GDT1 family protein [Rhodocyclaceae bacterium]|nr:TMEM165/GDT1 family protein [Rhodocyclaceae bacterium]